MNLLSNFRLSRAALGLAAIAIAVSGTAHATIISATDTLPTMIASAADMNTPQSLYNTAFYFGGTAGGGPAEPTQYNLGTFTFSNPSSIPTLVGLSISMTLNSLDTQSPGADDYGKIDLTLNGIDTGVAANGFGNATSTATVIGNLTAALGGPGSTLYQEFESGGYTYNPLVVSNVSTAGARGTHLGAGFEVIDTDNSYNIAADSYDQPLYGPSTTTTAGQLVVGLTYVGTQWPTSGLNSATNVNQFQLYGGSAQLLVSDQAFGIPFSPSQTLGFGLIALCLILWQIPQTNHLLRRVLVTAN